MNKNMIKIFIFTIFVISIFAFTSGRLTPAFVVNNDKIFHTLAFIVLSFMMHHSFAMGSLRKSAIFVLFVGVMIEVIQVLFTTRGFSFEDLGFDLLGVMLYSIIYYYAGTHIDRLEQYILNYNFNFGKKQ